MAARLLDEESRLTVVEETEAALPAYSISKKRNKSKLYCYNCRKKGYFSKDYKAEKTKHFQRNYQNKTDTYSNGTRDI